MLGNFSITNTLKHIKRNEEKKKKKRKKRKKRWTHVFSLSL